MSTHEIHEISDEQYMAVMRDAYPGPEKGKIAASVSARVKALERKRRLRQGFVKFGSIAACFAVVVFAGFRVIPMLEAKNLANDTAANTSGGSQSYIEDYDVPKEAAVEEYDDSVEKSKQKNNDKKAAIPEFSASVSFDCMLAGASNVAPQVEEAVDDYSDYYAGEMYSMESPESVAEEEIPEDALDSSLLESSGTYERSDFLSAMDSMSSAEDAAASDAGREIPRTLAASPDECEHTGVFRNSYHDIPKTVIDLALQYVSPDEIMQWYDSVSGTCGMNISAFLKMAGIPESDFNSLYNTSDLWYHHDYPVDILYSGNDTEIENYYKNGGSYDIFEPRYEEYEHKLDLYRQVGGSAYSAWADAHGYTCLKSWTLDDFYSEFGIK